MTPDRKRALIGRIVIYLMIVPLAWLVLVPNSFEVLRLIAAGELSWPAPKGRSDPPAMEVPKLAAAAIVVDKREMIDAPIPDKHGPPAGTASTFDTWRFSGTVTAIDAGCAVDVVCSVTVGDTTVITGAGRAPGPWGSGWGVPHYPLGTLVDVYCRRVSAESCTLQGNGVYYLRSRHSGAQ